MDTVLTEKKKYVMNGSGPYEEKKVRNEWIQSLRRKKSTYRANFNFCPLSEPRRAERRNAR